MFAQLSKRTKCRNGRNSVLQRQFRDTVGRQAGLNDDGVGPLLPHVRKSRLKLFGAKHFCVNHDPSGSATGFDLFEKRLRKGIRRIGQRRNSMRGRQHLSNQFYAFATEFRVHPGHAGDVSARPVEAVDKSVGDRISGKRHDDRSVMCRCLCSQRGRREPSHDEIDIEPHQLSSQFGEAAHLSVVRSKFVSNAPPLNVTRLAHRIPEKPPKLLPARSPNHQNADYRHNRLLRVRRERPRRRRAAKHRDEVAPLHSITSSARASTDVGMSSPSAFGALRLITSSNLVCACTGKSAGFSPLRMRSTYDAARRYWLIRSGP